MFKVAGILTLVIMSNLVVAQQIIYKPVFINQCTDSLAEDPYWWITDCDSNVYNFGNFSAHGVYLPKPGKYNLYFEVGEEPELLNIQSEGEIIDTFYTKRVELAIYVSNPPLTEFVDCNGLANGNITDFYYNGNVRLIGTFKDGQPIDTLKRFYSSGILQELYIPKKRNRRQINYFKNGKIKTEFNFAKNYSKEYYESGDLKKFEKWNRKYHTVKFEYYRNEKIKLEENKKRQNLYYSNGKIKRETTRKEVLILEKIFTKYGTSLYEYHTTFFDSQGNKLVLIQYGGNRFSSGIYPNSLNQIKDYQYEKIIIYKNGKATQIFDFLNQKENDISKAKQILYQIVM